MQKKNPKHKKQPITNEKLQKLIIEEVGGDLGEMPNSVAIAALTYSACMVASAAILKDAFDGLPNMEKPKTGWPTLKEMAETIFLGVYPRTASLYLASPVGGGIERPSGPVILGNPPGGPPRV